MLGIICFAAIVDTDFHYYRLTLSSSFHCTSHYGVYALIVDDGEVAAFESIGEATPLDMPQVFARGY